MTRSLLLVALLAACGGSSEPEAQPQDEVTAGDETPEGDEGEGEVGVLVYGPGGLRGTAAPQPGEQERAEARARREAERQQLVARCEAVAAPVPTRPTMPAITATPQLTELERVFDEAQRTPAPVPTDSTMTGTRAWTEAIAAWLPTRMNAIRALQEPAAQLSPPERATAATWVGHLYLDVVEALRGPPPPDSVANDPEVLAVYREAILDQTRPLAEQAKQTFEFCSAHAAGALNTHCGDMEAFAAGLACVLE